MAYEVTKDVIFGTLVKPDGIIPGDYVRHIETGEVGWVFNQWHTDQMHKIIIDQDVKGVLMCHWKFDNVELVACRWPNYFTRYCKIMRDTGGGDHG